MLIGVADPDYQGESGPLLYNGGKGEHVWNSEDPTEGPEINTVENYNSPVQSR